MKDLTHVNMLVISLTICAILIRVSLNPKSQLRIFDLITFDHV